MNRKQMNGLGRPARSYAQGNDNGHPVRKECSPATKVSQHGNKGLRQNLKRENTVILIDELDKCPPELQEAMHRIFFEELPSDYEECGTCGYDHAYSWDDPAARDHIISRHNAPDWAHNPSNEHAAEAWFSSRKQ